MIHQNKLSKDEGLTKDWKLKTQGENYNNRLKPNYYDTCDLNWEFFTGNQYPTIETDLSKPIFNVLKLITSYQVSSLCSTKASINIEPMVYSDDDRFNYEENIAKFVEAAIQNILDKHGFNYMRRTALFDGAVTGDYAIHIYFNPNKKAFGGAYSDYLGDVSMELVDGVNVIFGNANNRNVESQPWIGIIGRDTVENLEDEREQYYKEDSNITSDSDYNYQTAQGGKIEIESDDDKENKATYIIIYRKNDKGIVTASKSVANDYIYQDVETGLTRYPMAWGNWEEQKNQYHGRSLITGLIPNQIYINKMFAIMMYYLMNNAFPKVVYDGDRVSGWTSEVNVAIPVKNLLPGQSVRDIANYLNPGQPSAVVMQTIDAAMNYTKEMSGATDAALGNIRPENTSAILATQRAASIPLENPKSLHYKWVNDIVSILVDMIGNYYGVRPQVVEENGRKVAKMVDFSVAKDLWFNVKVDIGDGTYWSELASNQTLDNLLQSEKISFLQYLERVDDSLIVDKQGLIDEIKNQMGAGDGQDETQAMISQMSPEMQQQFMSMPPEQQQQLLQEFLGGTQ